MDSTSPDRVALRLSCVSHELWLYFRTAHERDRCLGSVGLLHDQTILIAPGEGFFRNKIYRGSDLPPDYPMHRSWPYMTTVTTCERVHRQFSTDPRLARPGMRAEFSCPRFAPIELEGVWEANLLSIDLPPLTELPWPQTHGACADEENQRAARERIAWGVATGLIASRRQAAEYLRTHAPARAKDAVRRIWVTLVGTLDLPD